MKTTATSKWVLLAYGTLNFETAKDLKNLASIIQPKFNTTTKTGINFFLTELIDFKNKTNNQE